MSADLHMALGTADAAQIPASRMPAITQASADRALRLSAQFWFVVTIVGQLLFAFTIASFYGLTAARGDLQAWNRFMLRGHVAGDAAGNFVVAIHLASAVVIILAGAIQFVPPIRSGFPRFHRWVGRTYMLTAFTLSMAGLYMHWIRGALGDASQRFGATLNAALIWLCVVMAVRYAIARDFRTHRRWVLRLFLVVSAAWFFRAAFFLAVMINKGPFGFDPATFTGPFLTVMSFAQYLVPLAILELYLRAQEGRGAARRLMMAAALFMLTIATAAGVLAITVVLWVPVIRAAYDSRKSIARTISASIASNGVEHALKQYRDLKATEPATYNFDEAELNRLGSELVQAKRLKDAIVIFQLNVETFPQSANAYDRLAEVYASDGNKAMAVASYRRSLQLNPDNRNAAAALSTLGQQGVSR